MCIASLIYDLKKNQLKEMHIATSYLSFTFPLFITEI